MKPALNKRQRQALYALQTGTKLPVLIEKYGRTTLAFLHSQGQTDLPRVLSAHGQKITYED